MHAIAMKPKTNLRRAASTVVATAHTPAGLREARALRASDVGWVEIRLDVLGAERAKLDHSLSDIQAPLLLTARHPAEGGVGMLNAAQRRGLLEKFLLMSAAIDIELRSVAGMGSLLETSRCLRVTKIVSFHDFRGTPGLPRLRQVVRRSVSAGADIVKIATFLRGPGDLAILLLLQSAAKVPLSTMGMGPLGKVSRLLLAAAGSRLNYGYLDKPQVDGQWPARELVHRIGEVLP